MTQQFFCFGARVINVRNKIAVNRLTAQKLTKILSSNIYGYQKSVSATNSL
jgi:hypothetical protein